MFKIRTNAGNVLFMTADDLAKFAFSLSVGYTILAYMPGMNG